MLNPWFSGAFALGFVAAKVSDRASLGFVVETERQVAETPAKPPSRLPEEDAASRAVVERMKQDEERHAEEARAYRGALPPCPGAAQGLMRFAAKVMTTTAHRI